MSQDEQSKTALPVAISQRPAEEPAAPLELDQLAVDKVKRLPGLLSELYKSVMRENTDYGRLPGTSKPSLFKPGAEILARWLNLAAKLRINDQAVDITPDAPYFSYTIECRLYGKNGFVGAGMGSCNSREPRYAFRWASENQVPISLDKTKLLTRSSGGRTQYRIPTPPEEIFGIANTVLKIAEKRAFVDAVLRVTGASRIFTQDIEEETDEPTASHAFKAESQSKPATDTSQTSQSGAPLKEWRVPVRRENLPEGVQQYPLFYKIKSVGVYNIDTEHSELAFLPDQEIRAETPPIQNFLDRDILQQMKKKHPIRFRIFNRRC